MPFTYFGGKKGLARYYPPPIPAPSTIVEPFAGSAGYALHWATPRHRVVLVEKDPAIVALWRRLQAPDARDDLMAVECPAEGERVVDGLLAFTVGGEAVGGRWTPAPVTDVPFAPFMAGAAAQLQTGLAGRPFQVTSRMARDWPAHRRRIASALPVIRRWTVIEGDYHDAPDVHATWFIDPPYWVPPDAHGTRGDGYRHGADALDFAELADWSRARRGQVIVCEQAGAAWLPFRPLREWSTARGDGGRRLEVVWTRTPGASIGQPARPRTQAAAHARTARMTR